MGRCLSMVVFGMGLWATGAFSEEKLLTCVVHQNPTPESAIVRCSKSSNTVTHTVRLPLKEGRSSTLPLRSDDAGHQVEETIESYFRLVEGWQSAGLPAYPSRAPDASDPHGSRVGIQR
jgi:hypothetical protein